MFNDHFKVHVAAGTNGNIIQTNPDKPEYGSIMFEQKAYTFRNNFLNARRKVSFLAGTVEELTNFTNTLELTAGGVVPGTLYTVEQFTPFYEGQQPKINPQSGRACLVDGAMIWSKTFYDPTGKAEDVYQTGHFQEGDIVAEPRTSRAPSILESIMLS
jgi:hypothetical protein